MNTGIESLEEVSTRRRKKSPFQHVNNWLHLWLGLASGVIVFIVCITAAIWVFSEEITYLTEPSIRAQIRREPVIIPSKVLAITQQHYPGKSASYAYYQQGTAIRVGVGSEREPERHLLYLNPYTGQIQGSKTYGQHEKGFFEWVLLGHQHLWLPKEIGQPLVNYGTLVFTILLITGLIWWYPAKWTRASRQKSFRIKWQAGWKRINVDLHNVLGFYALLVLLALSLSGMVYGLPWYSKGLYWLTSGGETEPEWKRVSSDPSQQPKQYTYNQAIDGAWARMIADYPSAGGFFYAFPDSTQATSTISIRTYPAPNRFYDVARHTFDRHTLQRLDFFEVFDKSFDESSTGAKLRRMNYDIHIGTILGMPGKMLAFFCSLIGASLPLTGFMVWWNRKGFGKKKRQPAHGGW